MARPFVRILEPSDPWFAEPPVESRLAQEFRGKYDSISVCDITRCPPDVALAAFYGNTTRPTPVRPALLRFTEAEVIDAGGRLSKTDAEPPWPPEYNDAHHDVDAGQGDVAAAMARHALAEPGRRAVADRLELVRRIVDLAVRRDAPMDFRKKAKKRLKRLATEEPSFFDAVLEIAPRARDILDP